MSRPDVALVAPYPPHGLRHAGSSGVASYTANLARALAGAGARVVVLAPEHAGEARRTHDGDITVLRCYRAGPSALPVAALAAISTRARIVHVQHELFLYGGISALPGLGIGLGRLRLSSSHTVLTLHQVVDPAVVDRGYVAMHRISAPAPLARAGLRLLQQGLVRAADATIVHEVPFTRILPGTTLIPHGVEGLRPMARSQALAHLRLRGDRLVVLCFGFLAPYKGLELALEAGTLAGDEVLVVVAGGDHPRLAAKEPYSAELRRRWGDTAHFTGYVPEGEIAHWHAAADVALLCYPEPHASSGALALAIAHETPFLLSPRLAECVGAGREATVDLDPAAIAARLKELAGDPDGLLRLRRQSERVGKDRSWPAVARRHLELYEETAHGHRPSGRRLRAA